MIKERGVKYFAILYMMSTVHDVVTSLWQKKCVYIVFLGTLFMWKKKKKKKSEVTIFTLCTFKNFPCTLGESRPFLFPPPPPPVHYWLAFHLLNIAFKPHLRHLNGSESSLLWVVLFKEKKKKNNSAAAFSHGLGGGKRKIPIRKYGGEKKKKGKINPWVRSTPRPL